MGISLIIQIKIYSMELCVSVCGREGEREKYTHNHIFTKIYVLGIDSINPYNIYNTYLPIKIN